MNTIKQFLFLALAFLAIAASSSSLAQEKAAQPLTLEQARAEQAYSIGVQAYIYGYPLVEMYRVRHSQVFKSAAKERTALNQFRHARKLLDHTATTVVAPNND